VGDQSEKRWNTVFTVNQTMNHLSPIKHVTRTHCQPFTRNRKRSVANMPFEIMQKCAKGGKRGTTYVCTLSQETGDPLNQSKSNKWKNVWHMFGWSCGWDVFHSSWHSCFQYLVLGLSRPVKVFWCLWSFLIHQSNRQLQPPEKKHANWT
jgi:hypothetical protein